MQSKHSSLEIDETNSKGVVGMCHVPSVRTAYFSTVRWAKVLVAVIFCLLSPVLLAHHPLSERDLADAAESPDWEVRRMKMDDVHRRSMQNLNNRESLIVDAAKGRAEGASDQELINRFFGGRSFAFPTGTGPLGSIGDRRILTVLIDFPDHSGSMDVDRIAEAINGNGGVSAPASMPFDSVRNYYSRASQGKLELGGTVVDWVQMDKPRASYKPSIPSSANDQRALLEIFTEALEKIDDTTDFSEFDNDNDGDIDGLVVLYAGPPEGWGEFFWAYRWVFYVPEAQNVSFDGKTLEQFVFQFVEERPNGDYEPTVLVHEMGHLLGLNDYYDYCPKQSFVAGLCAPNITDPGPDGGVGGFDMMDGNWGNHSAYSRWLLDWISPQIVGDGTHTVELRASGLDEPRENKVDAQDAVAIFPSLSHTDDSITPAKEMFIVEYRPKVGNDTSVPGDGGILVWHLAASPSDAPLNTGFDNSFTTPKQLRFLRSGETNDFRAGDRARADDFFSAEATFGPETVPPSLTHDGTHTGVSISNIEVDGDIARMTISVEPVVIAALNAPPNAVDVPATSSAGPSVPSDSESISNDLDKLLDLERAYSDKSAAELSELFEQASKAINEDSTPEQVLAARMLLVKWAQKDGVAALDAYESSDAVAKSVTAPIVDDALKAFVASEPLSAGDAFLSPERDTVRKLVQDTGTFDFVRSAFAARGHFDETDIAASLAALEGAETTYSAVRGLRAAGIDIERLNKIADLVDDEKTALRSVIDLERSIESFGAEFRLDIAPGISEEVLNSIIRQYDLQVPAR